MGLLKLLLIKITSICKKMRRFPGQVLVKLLAMFFELIIKRMDSRYLTNIKHSSNDQISSSSLSSNDEFLKSELGKKIQEVIEMQIQPSLGAHGGSVQLVDLVDGKLMVVFSGGCQRCSQASVTVKEGIEKILTAKFSEVEEIIDLTNHSTGQNPYFK